MYGIFIALNVKAVFTL